MGFKLLCSTSNRSRAPSPLANSPMTTSNSCSEALLENPRCGAATLAIRHYLFSILPTEWNGAGIYQCVREQGKDGQYTTSIALASSRQQPSLDPRRFRALVPLTRNLFSVCEAAGYPIQTFELEMRPNGRTISTFTQADESPTPLNVVHLVPSQV